MGASQGAILIVFSSNEQGLDDGETSFIDR